MQIKSCKDRKEMVKFFDKQFKGFEKEFSVYKDEDEFIYIEPFYCPKSYQALGAALFVQFLDKICDFVTEKGYKIVRYHLPEIVENIFESDTINFLPNIIAIKER